VKVVIFGVGRSGTSSIYSLLQNIMLDVYGDGTTDYVYEPFLWDREIFNDFYENYGEKYNYLDSLSVEGLYWHQKIPMFIEDTQDYLYNSYVKSLLLPRGGKSNLLMKSIRMNGRFKLFENLADEDTKFIFIIRNPVDVVNSVITKFSFFGNNYHKSDETRFFQQIKDIYNERYYSEELSEVEKQVIYWKYMNRFTLDYVMNYRKRALLLVYELYAKKPANTLDMICRYLGIESKKIYLDFITRRVGANTSGNNISYKDYIGLETYLDEYIKILEDIDCSYSLNREAIKVKYQKPCEIFYHQLNKGKIANVLEKQILHKDFLIFNKKNVIKKLNDVLQQKEKELINIKTFSSLISKELNDKEEQLVNIRKIYEEVKNKKNQDIKILRANLVEERFKRKKIILRKLVQYQKIALEKIKNSFRNKEYFSRNNTLDINNIGYEVTVLNNLIKNIILPENFKKFITISEKNILKNNVLLIPDVGNALTFKNVLNKKKFACFLNLPIVQDKWWKSSKSDQIDQLKRMFNSKDWKKIRNNCLGLITFSQYQIKLFSKFIDVPIKNIKYPLPKNYNTWSYEKFRENNNKKIIQIGWYMVRIHAIFMLPTSEYQKVYFKNFNGCTEQIFEKERKNLKSKWLYFDFMESTVSVSETIKIDELKELMTCNIGFIHYQDVALPTFVIQCISTCTPVLVNAHPIVVEYLGSDYPLYYYFYEDAIEKAKDEKLLLCAHKYMKKLRFSDELSIKYYEKQFNSLIFGEK